MLQPSCAVIRSNDVGPLDMESQHGSSSMQHGGGQGDGKQQSGEGHLFGSGQHVGEGHLRGGSGQHVREGHLRGGGQQRSSKLHLGDKQDGGHFGGQQGGEHFGGQQEGEGEGQQERGGEQPKRESINGLGQRGRPTLRSDVIDAGQPGQQQTSLKLLLNVWFRRPLLLLLLVSSSPFTSWSNSSSASIVTSSLPTIPLLTLKLLSANVTLTGLDARSFLSPLPVVLAVPAVLALPVDLALLVVLGVACSLKPTTTCAGGRGWSGRRTAVGINSSRIP